MSDLAVSTEELNALSRELRTGVHAFQLDGTGSARIVESTPERGDLQTPEASNGDAGPTAIAAPADL